MAKPSDAGRRLAMVERQVLEAVASYLTRDLKDDLPGLVTVSRVTMAGDLKAAKVYVSVLAPGEDEVALKKQVVKFLQGFAGDIQAEVDARLRLRYTPKLTFLPDETTEKILKVEGLLQELRGTKRDTPAKDDE